MCHQLGFRGGTAYKRAHYGEGIGDIWLDNVRCTGSETRLESCPKNNWGEENCSHAEDAGVSCGNYNIMELIPNKTKQNKTKEIDDVHARPSIKNIIYPIIANDFKSFECSLTLH